MLNHFCGLACTFIYLYLILLTIYYIIRFLPLKYKSHFGTYRHFCNLFFGYCIASHTDTRYHPYANYRSRVNQAHTKHTNFTKHTVWYLPDSSSIHIYNNAHNTSPFLRTICSVLSKYIYREKSVQMRWLKLMSSWMHMKAHCHFLGMDVRVWMSGWVTQ